MNDDLKLSHEELAEKVLSQNQVSGPVRNQITAMYYMVLSNIKVESSIDEFNISSKKSTKWMMIVAVLQVVVGGIGVYVAWKIR